MLLDDRGFRERLDTDARGAVSAFDVKTAIGRTGMGDDLVAEQL